MRASPGGSELPPFRTRSPQAGGNPPGQATISPAGQPTGSGPSTVLPTGQSTSSGAAPTGQASTDSAAKALTSGQATNARTESPSASKQSTPGSVGLPPSTSPAPSSTSAGTVQAAKTAKTIAGPSATGPRGVEPETTAPHRQISGPSTRAPTVPEATPAKVSASKESSRAVQIVQSAHLAKEKTGGGPESPAPVAPSSKTVSNVEDEEDDAALGESMEQGSNLHPSSNGNSDQPPAPALPAVAHLQIRLTNGENMRCVPY